MRRFCKILQERSFGAADIEIHNFNRDELDEAQYEKAIKTLQEGFELRISINGANGEELHGPIEEVFESANFPDNVVSLYVDSNRVLKGVHNYNTLNSFTVFLDFSKPAIFDFTLLPNQGTPNEANFEVQGYDATWVNGVFSEINNFIKERSSTFSVVHSHSVYDILLWFLGFPLAFWFCFKASSKLDSVSDNAFFESALYFYAFIATLFVFRIVFHYLRWICPLVEYRAKGSKIRAHRAILVTLLIGLVGTFVADIAKLAVGS